ncbi:MAG: xanthine dehydrogenase family protein subunit M [Planctomycetes bacterium]|nr:xanthine dehydrogenase family protein subunit M [Planctomycetota bacterium]
MRDFDYAAPSKLADALALMASANGSARPLAGGTDLIDHVRTGRLSPDLLIDIKKLPELNRLEFGSSGLRLGAAVPCWKIIGSREIGRDYSALVDSCRIIGGIQIQNRATLGGNLCNSGPAADSIPGIIALGGQCVIAGTGGTRTVSAEAFCTGPGKNVLQPGELLVELIFPTRAANSGSHYRRFIPRNEMDIAVVGVGASVTLDDSGQHFTAARIALGAVGPTPLLAADAGAALVGQAVNDENLAKAAAAARAVATPISDMRGTAKYRVHLVGVLVERVLKAAVARARGETIMYRPGH